MHHFLILSDPQLVLGGKLERRPEPHTVLMGWTEKPPTTSMPSGYGKELSQAQQYQTRFPRKSRVENVFHKSISVSSLDTGRSLLVGTAGLAPS